jgi:hypothetical protein
MARLHDLRSARPEKIGRLVALSSTSSFTKTGSSNPMEQALARRLRNGGSRHGAN